MPMNEKTRLLVNKNPTRMQVINKNEEDEAICHGYRSNIAMKIFFYLLVTLSLGTVILLFYWKPNWKLYLIARKSDLSKAHFILIQDVYKRSTVVKVKTISNQNLSSERDSYGSNDDNGNSYQSFPDSMNQSVVVNEAANSSTKLFSPSPKKNQPNPNEIRYFRYHLIRYAWNQSRRQFEKIYGLDHLTTCHRLVNDFKGFPAQVQDAKMRFYGDNSIEVKVKSYVRLFFEEILTPFYIFQIMACTLWIIDDYYLYAGCIIGISLTSIIISLIETKRQSQTLHDMVKTNFKVKVCRGGDEFEEIPSENLVPGDIIEIPSNHASVMTCDAVLLNGTCILNESMLTGESVPVVKSPLHEPENINELYNVETHKRHTLFNGTKVVQTRNYDGSRVLAVVIRTGFSTAKGELVRGILFPKPMGFKFYEDSLKFILFLFCVAIIGMGYGIVVLANKGVRVRDLIIRALDIVTIVVPPALPAAMTVGTVYAQSRLKKKSIYCISPPRINVGGKLKLICFDKTGTLTEDGLDIWGVLGVDKKLDFKHPIHNIADGLEDGKLLRTLATCHSLSRYEGALTGDPLDIKMFESTKWEFIDEPPVGGSNGRFEKMCPIVRKPKGFRTFIGSEHGEREEIAIVKQFTFSSALLRMSVICRSSHDDYMEVYSKGAPEKIVELCKPQTVPNDFHEILKIYTANGYRVIALAGKNLPPEVSWQASTKLPRDQVESDLDFYGLLIMQNAMKPETTRIISELAQADLTTLMVTGDNLLTALCVARKCGMIPKWNKVIIVEAHAEQEPEDLEGDGLLIARTNKVPPRIEWKLADESVDLDNLDLNAIHQHANHPDIQSVVNVTPTQDSYNFAMTGKTFAILRKSFPKILERVLVNGTVYARMSPEQKAQLVEHLISIGYCVSMCGDGANDTIALKAAHVGISLSEAEASVASPFTSKIQNISCVPEVIKEGRAALVTSFGVFKYMALYSMIQFISVLILYAFMTNLADQQFLYIDLLLITPVAVFMSANQAYRKLAKKRPLGSLVGFVNICSILFQIALVLAFQLLTFFYLVKQPWYEPNNADRDNFKNNVKTMEGTAVFLISTYQYVIMAFVYSRGPPYRQSILHNFWFVFSLLVLTALNIWITLAPLPEIRDLLSMKELDPGKDISLFRINIVFIAVIFFILSFSIEELIVNSKGFKKLGKIIIRKKHPKNKYKILKQEIEKDPHWPYIGRITFENN